MKTVSVIRRGNLGPGRGGVPEPLPHGHASPARQRACPLSPLTLFGHRIRRCGASYLADRLYLKPHPVEPMPCNLV